MNYYNPYYLMPSVKSTSSIGGIFSRGNINFSSILNGVQRFLGLANQALPLIKEAAPMMRNAKTMFKVMNEFKKTDSPIDKNINSNNQYSPKLNNTNRPTFFA